MTSIPSQKPQVADGNGSKHTASTFTVTTTSYGPVGAVTLNVVYNVVDGKPTPVTTTTVSDISAFPIPPAATPAGGSQPAQIASSSSATPIPQSTTASPDASTSPTASSSSGGGSHISAGALAGGIIGAALVAALITFLATFLICKRRNRREAERHRHSPSSRDASWTSYKDGTAVSEKAAPGDSEAAGMAWLAFLPQPADDRTIRNAVKTLYDQIGLHVDNYYHRADVTIDEHVETDLAAVESSHLPASIAQLMSGSDTAMTTINHCIANLLISRITPGDNTGRSLLAPRYAASPTRNASATAAERNAVDQAHSQWRTLNAFLFPQAQKESADSRRLQSVVTEVAELLHFAFMPWESDRNNEEALKQHQRSVIMRAADLGALIQSQAPAYEFDWTGPGMVMLPAFVKTSDEKGRVLATPQILVKASSA